jgi:hypothetical protein
MRIFISDEQFGLLNECLEWVARDLTARKKSNFFNEIDRFSTKIVSTDVDNLRAHISDQRRA